MNYTDIMNYTDDPTSRMTDNTTQNATLITGLSEAEKYLLLSWTTLFLIISIPGNILILVASLKYQAIKLDKYSVIFIQNMAIIDVTYATVDCILLASSIIANGWVFGDMLCSLRPVVMPILRATSIFFITALNVAKLTTLLDPFGARLRTNRSGYRIAGALWSIMAIVVALTELLIFLISGMLWLGKYDAELFVCKLSTDSWSWYFFVAYLLTIACVVVPLIIVIVTTVWLMRFVQERGIQRQTVVTLVTISAVFVLSYTPLLLSPLLKRIASGTYAVYYRS